MPVYKEGIRNIGDTIYADVAWTQASVQKLGVTIYHTRVVPHFSIDHGEQQRYTLPEDRNRVTSVDYRGGHSSRLPPNQFLNIFGGTALSQKQ